MRFREVQHAPAWLVAFIYFLFLSLVLSVWAALGNTFALITLILLTSWLFILYFKTALSIEVDEVELRVGRAHIQHRFIGEVSELDSEQLRMIRTRDADPAAYLAIRFWAKSGVKVEVKDDRDPTPYWLITSRKAKLLRQSLKS